MQSSNSGRQTRLISDGITIALLVGTLTLPLLGWAFGWRLGGELEERRALAEAPSVGRTVETVRSFPERFEAYFEDHYGFRSLLVRWNNILTVAWLGSPPVTSILSRYAEPEATNGLDLLSRRVQVAPDGWFFFFAPSTMSGFRGITPVDPDELARWKQLFGRRHAWLRERGIEYLLVFAPEKHSIYPEKLPRYIVRGAYPPRTEAIIAYLQRDGDLPVLDLRRPLLDAKRDRLVYYKTGTHWNEFGAYVAYASLMQRLGEMFPGLTPQPLSDFRVREEHGAARDFLRSVALENVYSDEWTSVEPRRPRRARSPMGVKDYESPPEQFGIGSTKVRETPLRGAPSAMIFHDSFTRTHLDEFLSEHFSHTSYCWCPFRERKIEREKPDVVIEIRAERYFDTGYGKAELNALPRSR